ncbi:hypothetical protein GW626_21725 [Peribacillus muralis]|uniref:hypothetical protein n=1 Tax=Peribacillus muralis TaxID=264697 RepID=UPI001F4ED193|nr:hypothetical protein [Peribacillus muralis]MCK1994503.1 hypothetical protein [Peribacillus muralis]MCK2015263.1 hypothetical protein [Peribacillus muralis]
MSEECRLCLEGEDSLTKFMQDNKQMEERLSVLIGHMAKNHVRTWDIEFELGQVKSMLIELELQNKYLYDHNEKLTKRISALEKGAGYLNERKKLREAGSR